MFIFIIYILYIIENHQYVNYEIYHCELKKYLKDLK